MLRKSDMRERQISGGEDERLSALMQKWRGIEPRPDFEASVWRRIRANGAREEMVPPIVVFLRGLLAPQLAWANVAVLVGAIFLGVWAGNFGMKVHEATLPLLHSQTLAGSYLAMATGEQR